MLEHCSVKAAHVIAVLAVTAIMVGAGVFVILNNRDPDDYDTPIDPLNTPPSQWSYVGGDVGIFGVTDSKTPITESEMVLVWKTTDAIGPGGLD